MNNFFNGKPDSDEVLSNPFSTPSMPEYKDIPDEFKNFNSTSKWNRFFDDMFFSGVQDLVLFPKENIDDDRAFRHLMLWARSFEPSHEHKSAAFAYVMSLWFDDVKWNKRNE